MLRALALLLVSIPVLFAQQRVPEEFQRERILVIVPIIGTGQPGDPIRPMFAPIPPAIPSKSAVAAGAVTAQEPTEQQKFLSMQFELSDDGKSALVEFVATDRAAFQEILAYKGLDVKVFERNKNTKQDVEREFGQLKANYKFDKAPVDQAVGGAQ